MKGRIYSLMLCAAWVGLAAARLAADEKGLPEPLKDRALSVSIQAYALDVSSQAVWEQASIRYTVAGTPVSLKLVGTNVVILVQVTPFDEGKDGLTIVAQSQVWVKRPAGDISYRTTLDTVVVSYGESILFFPLGRDGSGKGVIRIAIVVDRYREDSQASVDATEPAAGALVPLLDKSSK